MTEEQVATEEQAPSAPVYAFRCNNCDSLAEAGHAGEREIPAKCTTCGKGVHFTEDGIKVYDPDNWTVLADLDGDGIADVLSYHGIVPEQIERHVPFDPPTEPHEPVNIAVEAVEEVTVENTGAQA